MATKPKSDSSNNRDRIATCISNKANTVILDIVCHFKNFLIIKSQNRIQLRSVNKCELINSIS